MEDQPDDYYEEDTFIDCDIVIEGTLLTPDNTLLHLFRPLVWSSAEVMTNSGEIADIILEEDLIRHMIRSGFSFRAYDHPSDGYKEWFVLKSVQHLDAEITAFYDELG